MDIFLSLLIILNIVLLAGKELLSNIEEVVSDIPQIPIFVNGKSGSQLDTRFTSLDDIMLYTDPVPVCKAVRKTVSPVHPIGYIYTSGTTGIYIVKYMSVRVD